MEKGKMKGVDGVKFELWRQDDNGNRFLVEIFPNRAGAEKLLAALIRNPHKQIYWIRETTEDGEGGG